MKQTVQPLLVSQWVQAWLSHLGESPGMDTFAVPQSQQGIQLHTHHCLSSDEEWLPTTKGRSPRGWNLGWEHSVHRG